MDLAQRLDNQIKRAAGECTASLAKGELPDPACLALAVAGGETADSLMAKTKERLDRRAASNVVNEPPAKTTVQVPEVAVKDVPFVDLRTAEDLGEPEQVKAHKTHHTTKHK